MGGQSIWAMQSQRNTQSQPIKQLCARKPADARSRVSTGARLDNQTARGAHQRARTHEFTTMCDDPTRAWPLARARIKCENMQANISHAWFFKWVDVGRSQHCGLFLVSVGSARGRGRPGGYPANRRVRAQPTARGCGEERQMKASAQESQNKPCMTDIDLPSHVDICAHPPQVEWHTWQSIGEAGTPDFSRRDRSFHSLLQVGAVRTS